jgi:CRISPR-associated protein Cmr5
MATLDQQRAKLAFKRIREVEGWDTDKNERPRGKKYASIVHAMPALLRSAGLSQALHFVHSRKTKEQHVFLDHLAEQLARVDAGINDSKTLLAKVREANLSAYLRLTQEALACVVWYRRFVQGELGIDAGDDDGREDE